MVIDEFKPNNPTYYERLRERLEKIIQDEYERRKKNANYFTNPAVYEEIYNLAINEEQERKKLGINKSTLWYLKRNISDEKSVKIYDKILSKLEN